MRGVFVLAACAAAGCSSKTDREAVYPVRGVVTYQGKPAADAIVSLYVKGGDGTPRTRPSGRAGADGSFAVGTYFGDDGAPPGEYAVVVTWHPLKPDGTGQLAYAGPDRLGGKFADPAKTPLKATVGEGENTLPIDLN